MEKILAYIEEKKEIFLNQLIEFLRIPSISSQAKHKPDIEKCTVWLENHLKQIGLKQTRIIPTAGSPIVYAEWLGAGTDSETVLIYGHYDVQPVDPMKLWNSPPFEPKISNGKIFARGTADDKGQLFTHLKAIEAYLAVEGKLPVNVKLIFEGEEEASVSHLDEFVENNAELLACDTVLVSDTEWFADGIPTICYSLRGITIGEITVFGPNRDVHSGSFGGGIENPLIALCNIISKMKNEKGKINIPGFYDDVLELTEEEKVQFRKLPFDEEEYCKDLGISQTYGEEGYSTLERVWARPTFELNGIFGGYTEEGSKTIIPSNATAKISLRLVPNQNPSEIARKTEEFIKSLIPPTVKAEVKFSPGGSPVLVPRDIKGMQAAKNAFNIAFDKEVVYMRDGGSIPVLALFEQILKAPTVLMGFGLPTDNIHSPNENMDLNNFFGGIKTSALFLNEYAKL
ncbi:MAG: peptidase [Ignavibacteria bacterium]|nr:peptidase [Ignavibacteria bacterium]